LRSLRRTREAARKTASALALDTRLRQETRNVEPPRPAPANPLVQRRPAPTAAFDPQRTMPMASAGGAPPPGEDRTVFLPRPDAPVPPPEQPRQPKPWWKNRWFLIIGTSVVAFVIGMLALTGFEKITGQAVSGGSGTTFGQVVGRSAPSPST